MRNISGKFSILRFSRRYLPIVRIC